VSLIETHGLTKYYQMGSSVVRALDGVDLAIEQGEFVAITGASGSGKSTMMHLLGCLDRPTSGRYLLDGRDVSGLSDQELAAVRNKQIGFVFQTFNLINRTTAWENVSVPLFYARQAMLREPAMRALERVGLAERATHQPSELSGGERQRVAVARAIVNDPLLLFADEPTGNLDTRTGEQIMRIMHDLNEQGVTVIIVTHEREIAEQARRIVQMRDGKIILDRPTAEILAEEGRSAVRVSEEVSADVAEVPPEPEVEAEQAVDLSGMPPRLIPGATAGLICGVVSVVLFGVSHLVQWVAALVYAEEYEAIKKMQAEGNFGASPMQVSIPLMVVGLVSVFLFLSWAVLAVLAIVFSSRARKRARTELGNWIGQGRALAGLLMGWGVIGVTLIGFVYGIVKTVGAIRGAAG
jgi:putative ABC transport system ATP-binding protein